MARFSVLVRPRPTARLVRIFEMDDFSEAEELAVNLTHPEIWVDDADSPRTAYTVWNRQLAVHRVPLLQPQARAEIEAFYLEVRDGLLESGMPKPDVDEILPLDHRGNVPWIPYNAPVVLADARPKEWNSRLRSSEGRLGMESRL